MSSLPRDPLTGRVIPRTGPNPLLGGQGEVPLTQPPRPRGEMPQVSRMPRDPQIFDMGQRPQGGQMQRPQGGRMPLGVAPSLNAQMRRQNPEMFGQLGQQNQPLMQEMIGRGGTNAQLQEAAALNAANSRAVQQEPQIAGGFLNRMKNFSMQSGPPMPMQSPSPLNDVGADGLSANDLQRQLNRRTFPAEDLASIQARINDLQTQAPMPSPPPFTPPAGDMGPPPSPFGFGAGPMLPDPGPAPTAQAPQQQFAEGYGPQVQMASPQQQMLSQMQNRGFSSPQPQMGPPQQSPYMGSAPRDYHANDFERMGPPPQQQIQPAPQQQMAGGYGLTGSYQGDQFSRGVMSLPQIQDNFYSPPAGGYTAPPITSPYSMF